MRSISLLTLLPILLFAGCASPGYHYETGSFKQVPDDICMREDLGSSGGISWLNSSIGTPSGVPAQVISITDRVSPSIVRLSSLGYRFPSTPNSVLCHVTLTYANGAVEGGVLSLVDPGQYAKIQIQWIPDAKIAATLASRNQLRTAKSLLVRPDLDNPEIQRCVGKETALGRSEQFPGQTWAACADKLGLKRNWDHFLVVLDVWSTS
jgi:hypothetical protein